MTVLWCAGGRRSSTACKSKSAFVDVTHDDLIKNGGKKSAFVDVFVEPVDFDENGGILTLE